MQNASHGIDLLLAGAEEYAPSRVADNLARLQDLGLVITIREVQAMSAGTQSVFISEIDVSTGVGEKGITVTAVGMGDDMPSAVKQAVGQWVLGVLPVLAHWRGKHSCFTTSQQLETKGGNFE